MSYSLQIIVLFKCILLIQIPPQSGQSLPKAYSSYRPYPLCNPSDYFRYPTTISEVVSIVQEAIRRNITVKAFGARHSQTDIICTEGIPISNQNLKFSQLNPDSTATFGAGVTLHEATEYLRGYNRAFKTTPAYGNITLAGAIGTGAHGSSIKYTSSISSQVLSLQFVDGLGNIQEITKEGDLKSFRIHLGLLGIIVKITLITYPLYKTTAFNKIVPDSILTDGTAQIWAQTCDQMSLYWFPSFGQVVVSNWSIVDVDSVGDAHTYDHVPSTYTNFNLAVGEAVEQFGVLASNPCPAIQAHAYTLLNVFTKYMQLTLVSPTPDFVPIYEENGLFKNPATGYYDKMFAPTCIDEPGYGPLQCIWGHGEVKANATVLDNEISVALSDMPEFIKDIKDILTKVPTLFPLQGILMRFSGSSTSYMSTSYGRDSVGFEFYVGHRKNRYSDAAASLAGYQTIIQLLVNKYGGRSHWGKSGLVYHSRPYLDLKLDPEARSGFIAAMNKFDPNGIFLNNFGLRLKGISTSVDYDPKTLIHCALLDTCICSDDSDCASYQTCTNLNSYNYNVCLTKGQGSPSYLPLDLTLNGNAVTTWLSNTLLTLTTQVEQLTCLLNGG